MQSKPNWPLLAAWRFVLATIVVVFHLQVMYRSTFRGSQFITNLGADHAVLCFLLLSGFSIAHSIKERPQGFIIRRMWRIYPVYLACFLLSLLPFAVWGPLQKTPGGFTLEPPSSFQAVVHLFIGQPLLSRSFRIFNPSWTLGVEWAFYMLAPLFLRAPRKAMQWIISISAIWFMIKVVRVGLPEATGPTPYLSLLWVWLLGFYIVRFDQKNAAFVLICVPLLIIPLYARAAQGAFLWTATVSLVFIGDKILLPTILSKLGQKLGDLSYSLYLIHVSAFT
jgi:peptidoglycan/LPS O-acetylase OafA/YrhL